jgi:hypothetical protein
MLKIGKVAAATLCAFLIAPSIVNAAMVSKERGTVLVNKGKGFVEIASEAELAPGHQVMVQPGGSASIAYAGTCVVRLGSGVWWVQAAAPCANGVTEIDFTGRMNQATDPADPGVAPLVVGGVIIAGAITAGVLISQNNDKAASP